MRRILKSAENAKKFNDWALRKGFSKWEEFSGSDEYRMLREHLGIMEQDAVSAYTEQPLNERLWHIVHFRKRDLYPNLTFSYNNFLVDNRNDNYGACYKDGHKTKISRADFDHSESIFNPVEENLSQHVIYNARGEMLPALGLENSLFARVEKTIRVFNLNHSILVKRRSDLIQDINHYINGGLDASAISDCLKDQGFTSLIDWWLKTIIPT